MSSGNGSRPQGGASKTVEYKLRSISSAQCIHNIMTLSGPPVDLSTFTTPVRLVRESVMEVDEGGVANNNNNNNIQELISRKTKKTRIIKQEDEEESTTLLRSQEKAPWLLEDFDGQHSYVSQLMAPDSKYVFFVNQKNEFRVILASKWYKFNPKLTFRPLSLEEAEERMASKGKHEDYDRWLMRKRTQKLASTSGESSGSASVAPTTGNTSSNILRTRMVNLGEEGFDFDEIVDDDDGEDLGGGGDDPSMPRFTSTRKELTEAGKSYKKIVKHLDKGNYMYESDEEKDPYAEGAGQLVFSSDEEDEKKRIPSVGTQSRVPIPQIMAFKPGMSYKPGEASSSKNSLSRSRSKSPSGPRPHSQGSSSAPSLPQTATVPSTSSTSSQSVPSGPLTEVEIISILKERPMTTKDLISRVKNRLKADPANKDIFRDIVRKVAAIKTSSSQDSEDKLLELKPEFM